MLGRPRKASLTKKPPCSSEILRNVARSMLGPSDERQKWKCLGFKLFKNVAVVFSCFNSLQKRPSLGFQHFLPKCLLGGYGRDMAGI